MKQSFILILTGIILESSCVIGLAISSLNKFNDPIEMLFSVFLIPNLLSYIFIFLGLLLMFKKK
ncbi:MAG: hypothetical protein N4A50_00800 [Vallitalea sp.]|jgi:heme/copper-type cytochrome/quinol oxidase subunit 3|nr:hypothetical protein [Vallitalea sp.]